MPWGNTHIGNLKREKMTLHIFKNRIQLDSTNANLNRKVWGSPWNMNKSDGVRKSVAQADFCYDATTSCVGRRDSLLLLHVKSFSSSSYYCWDWDNEPTTAGSLSVFSHTNAFSSLFSLSPHIRQDFNFISRTSRRVVACMTAGESILTFLSLFFVISRMYYTVDIIRVIVSSKDPSKFCFFSL